MDTIKVKPWHASQGDHVVINAEDFDAEKHQRLDVEDKPRAKPGPKPKHKPE
jgi:hypothetical protein